MTCEKTWAKFKMKNMGDYHNHYGLDLCHYFSSPGSSCNAMLKLTVVKLEKTPDIINTYLLKKN